MSSSIGWRANFWMKSSTGLELLGESYRLKHAGQGILILKSYDLLCFSHLHLRFNVLVKPDLFCSFCEKLLAEQALCKKFV